MFERPISKDQLGTGLKKQEVVQVFLGLVKQERT